MPCLQVFLFWTAGCADSSFVFKIKCSTMKVFCPLKYKSVVINYFRQCIQNVDCFSFWDQNVLIRFLAETYKQVLDTSVGMRLFQSAHRWQLLGTSFARVAKISFDIILKWKDQAFLFFESVFDNQWFSRLLVHRFVSRSNFLDSPKGAIEIVHFLCSLQILVIPDF